MLERIFPSIQLRRERTQRLIAEEITSRKAAEAIGEAIPVFAKDTDEDQWKTSGTGRQPLGYTESDLSEMWTAALELSYHAGGRGLLDTMESFVIGESVKVIVQDENPDVQEYWDNWAKVSKWEMRCKEAFRRFLRDGEVFFRWFKPPEINGLDGKKYLLTRFIEPDEIKAPSSDPDQTYAFGIKTDPDDIEKVQEYHRWYMRGAIQKEEWIPAAEIDHFKHGVDSNVKRGLSWLMGVAKYLRLHEQWLDFRIQLNRLRTLWAVKGNVKGVGANDITSIKNKFADTTGKTNSGEGTPKKMPSAPMVWIQKGIDWEMDALNINASDAAEDGRNIQLMICAGTGLAEYVVRGDASNANFSSTMVAESPMVKMFEKYQDFVRHMIETVFARVIKHGIATGDLSGNSTKTIEGQLRNARRRYNNALREGRIHLVEDIAGDIAKLLKQKDEPDDPKDEPKQPKPVKVIPEPKKEEVLTSTECQVEFPPLIHRDILQETSALAIHQDRKWASRQTCSATMGYDYDQEKKEIEKDEADETDLAKQTDKANWS